MLRRHPARHAPVASAGASDSSMPENQGFRRPSRTMIHTVSTKPDASAGAGKSRLNHAKIQLASTAAKTASLRSAAISVYAASAARTALNPMNPLLTATPATPTYTASVTAMSAPRTAMTACRHDAPSNPSKKSRPGTTPAAKSVEPMAETTDSTHLTMSSGNGSNTLGSRPNQVANGQSNQKAAMNGAARNGSGSTLASSTVTAPTKAASPTIATQRAAPGTKKLPSARPMRPELNPNRPRPSSVRSPPSRAAVAVPTTTETTK